MLCNASERAHSNVGHTISDPRSQNMENSYLPQCSGGVRDSIEMQIGAVKCFTMRIQQSLLQYVRSKVPTHGRTSTCRRAEARRCRSSSRACCLAVSASQLMRCILSWARCRVALHAASWAAMSSSIALLTAQPSACSIDRHAHGLQAAIAYVTSLVLK